MKHHAKRSAVMQVLLSFVFLKPAMDAYRVTSGQKQEPGQIFSAITEVMISKMGETLFEAMPACSVQVYALLRLGGEIPIIMAVSILLSASTIALSTTIVSYDKDIGPKERSSMPHIYGYILNNPRYRFIVFVCMSAVSMIQVIVKSISVSLLALGEVKRGAKAESAGSVASRKKTIWLVRRLMLLYIRQGDPLYSSLRSLPRSLPKTFHDSLRSLQCPPLT